MTDKSSTAFDYPQLFNLALGRVALVQLASTIHGKHDKRLMDAHEILKEVEEAMVNE